MISAYLGVPLGAVIFVGLLWKRGNTAGRLREAWQGSASACSCFLDQTLGWSLPVLAHPYLHSFLHRTFFVWLFAAAVMIAVSLLTDVPPRERVEGNLFAFVGAPKGGPAGYRLWAALLFACTVALWWTFR